MRQDSRTRRILEPVVEYLTGRYEVEILDVNALAFPPVTPETLAQRSSGIVPDEVCEAGRKVADADRLVIAAPFWDMSFPSVLKAFIENISLFGITFTEKDNTCTGLCRCTRVLYLATRGMDIKTGSLRDQGTSYLKALSTLWGTGDVLTVAAENLDYVSPEEVDARISEAVAEALDICRTF